MKNTLKMKSEIDRLGDFILKHYPEQIEGSAVDTAIKILTNAKAINELRDLQGQKGTIDSGNESYMVGLYNGLELASCSLENRDPIYKQPEGKEESKILDKDFIKTLDNADKLMP